MVKPGSIIGGFIIAISIAMQVITLVEIAHYYWLLFIWFSGLVAGVTYVLGGLAFAQDKMEYFIISGISLGAVGALTAYFSFFQGEPIFYKLAPFFQGKVYWVFGAIGISTGAAILMAIAPLFIVAGAGKTMKGIKPGAIIGGILISGSLTLQVITVIHFANFYYLLFFWFTGLIGAIALSIGARAKWGYNSTEAFVTAGVFIGILITLVVWWTVSPAMRANIHATTATVTHNIGDILPTILSFVSGVVAFFGVVFCAASDTKR
ncbi:MAG: hypothetical protein ACTSO7_15860 [Candidatus Heimdallarchaeota archaeon]